MRALLVSMPFVLAPAGLAQVTSEWDREIQIDPPARFVMGRAYADANGGWFVTGQGANLVNISTFVYWQAQFGLMLRADAQGVVMSTDGIGSGSLLPPLAVGPTGNVIVRRHTTLDMLDAAGNLLWSAPLPSFVHIFGIGFAPDGGIRAGGDQFDGGSSSLFAAGWTASGTPMFFQTLPMSGANALSSVSSTGFVAVTTRVNGANGGAAAVFRPDGTLAWSGAVGADFDLVAIACTAAGELVVVGTQGSSERATLWDANGNPLWSHTEPTSNTDFANVAVSADGDVAIVGRTKPSVAEPYDGLVAVFELDGTALWSRTWSASAGALHDRLDQVAFRASGELMAGGTTYPSPLEAAPAVTCWSRDGALAWQYVGPSTHDDERCKSLEETASGSIVVANAAWTFPPGSNVGTPSGRLFSIRPQARAFCFGDGSGTACPCANHAEPGTGAGCLHSFGTGALLGATGDASVAGDTLVLRGSGMPSTSSVLYFQGTSRQSGGDGAVFGDGKRCAAGAVTRLGSRLNAAGASEIPGPGGTPIHVTGSVSAGDVRTYQAWYRNSAAFCTPSGFNLTNGVEIRWGP